MEATHIKPCKCSEGPRALAQLRPGCTCFAYSLFYKVRAGKHLSSYPALPLNFSPRFWLSLNSTQWCSPRSACVNIESTAVWLVYTNAMIAMRSFKMSPPRPYWWPHYLLLRPDEHSKCIFRLSLSASHKATSADYSNATLLWQVVLINKWIDC